MGLCGGWGDLTVRGLLGRDLASWSVLDSSELVWGLARLWALGGGECLG